EITRRLERRAAAAENRVRCENPAAAQDRRESAANPVVALSEPSRREEAQGGTMKGTATPGLSRRAFLASASELGSVAITSSAAPAQITTLAPFEKLPPYGNNTLPAGVKPRLVPNVNGLTVNMLEAGTQGRPLVLLLHGFPNLGYSWRKVMPAIADAGYYVI